MANRASKLTYAISNIDFFLFFYVFIFPLTSISNSTISIFGNYGSFIRWFAVIYLVCSAIIACWGGFKIQKKLGYPPHEKLLELTKRYNASKSTERKKPALEANKLPEDATPHDTSELELLGKEKKYLPFCAFIMHPKARQGFRYTIVAFVAAVLEPAWREAWLPIFILMFILIAIIFMIALWRIALAVIDVA